MAIRSPPGVGVEKSIDRIAIAFSKSVFELSYVTSEFNVPNAITLHISSRVNHTSVSINMQKGLTTDNDGTHPPLVGGGVEGRQRRGDGRGLHGAARRSVKERERERGARGLFVSIIFSAPVSNFDAAPGIDCLYRGAMNS